MIKLKDLKKGDKFILSGNTYEVEEPVFNRLLIKVYHEATNSHPLYEPNMEIPENCIVRSELNDKQS